MKPSPGLSLRDVVEADLEHFFAHQRDPEANTMAAFPPRDRDEFMAHWRQKVLGDDQVFKRTVVCDGRVAGSIVSYPRDDRRLVGYWLGKEFWGQGLATRALAAFLAQMAVRPVYAVVARRNLASIKVLEKCGFRRSSEQIDRHGSDAVEVFEYVLG